QSAACRPQSGQGAKEAGKAETPRRGNGEAQGGAWRRPRRREESEGRIVTACTMAKKSQVRPDGFVLFDVLYEDGTQTSNRKVPASELGGLDGDLPARTFVEAQDREISMVSGRPRGRIKSISRSRKTIK